MDGTFVTNNLNVGRNGNEIMNLGEDMIAETNQQLYTSLYWCDNGWKLLEVGLIGNK